MITLKNTFKIILISILSISFSTSYSQSDSLSSGKISPIQVSFIPLMSFNPMPNTDGVYVSINILGGYVKSVHAVEVGSMLNIVRHDAKAVQASGMANITLGNIEGVQASGMINTSRNGKGCQVAGMVNVNRKDFDGCQASGMLNVNGGKLQGVQVAGMVNTILNIGATADSTTLFVQQISGLTNISKSSITGSQIAGINNICYSIKGAQVAGLANTAMSFEGGQISGLTNQALGKSNGAQIAGLLNIANEVKGTQISGLVNVAKTVTGAQIGVVNIADSVNGISLGVLSIIRNGYHKLEISGDEKYYTNIAFRTGLKSFHNIIFSGINPTDLNAPYWTFGYGVGTTFGKSDKLNYDIDLTSQHLCYKSHVNWENSLIKLYFGVDRKIASKVSLAAGITGNMLIADAKNSTYQSHFTNFAPYSLSTTNFDNGYKMKVWLGAKVAIRFL